MSNNDRDDRQAQLYMVMSRDLRTRPDRTVRFWKVTRRTAKVCTPILGCVVFWDRCPLEWAEAEPCGGSRKRAHAPTGINASPRCPHGPPLARCTRLVRTARSRLAGTQLCRVNHAYCRNAGHTAQEEQDWQAARNRPKPLGHT